jgi:hypothetical protein
LSAADALEQIATMRARAIEVLVNMVSLLFELVTSFWCEGVKRHYGAVSPAYVKRFTFAPFFEIGRTVAHPLAEREQLQQIPASEVALRAFFAAVQ